MRSKIIPFPVRSRPAAPQAPTPAVPAPEAATVTFKRPFKLPGMDVPHAAGTFELRTTRHDLDVMWDAYRVTTRIMLPSGSAMEALDVSTTDLEAALALDGAASD
jgi:hypothetical protein